MRIVNLFILTLFLLSSKISVAQTVNEIIKVSYVTTPLSPSVVSMLRKQINDPNQLNSITGTLQKHKGYYTLYIDAITRESLFVLDSLHSEPGVSSPGNIEYVYINLEGEMTGKELFMNSTFNIKDNITQVKWNILDETKTLNGKNAQNATIENSSDVLIWFTKDILTSRGPGYYQGLLGLVLEASDFFTTTYVTEVANIEKTENIMSLFAKYKEKVSGKTYSLPELLKLKQNFIKTLKTE